MGPQLGEEVLKTNKKYSVIRTRISEVGNGVNFYHFVATAWAATIGWSRNSKRKKDIRVLIYRDTKHFALTSRSQQYISKR